MRLHEATLSHVLLPAACTTINFSKYHTSFQRLANVLDVHFHSPGDTNFTVDQYVTARQSCDPTRRDSHMSLRNVCMAVDKITRQPPQQQMSRMRLLKTASEEDQNDMCLAAAHTHSPMRCHHDPNK